MIAAGADSAVVLGAVCTGDVAANCEQLVSRLGPDGRRRGGPIYLTGFMGAGKTAVGKRLAQRLGLPFVDLDHEIERRSGRTIPDLFRERGEAEFRSLESEALEQSALARVVVATGGGVVERPPNVAIMLRTGRVLWLDVPFDTLLERLARSNDERPLFQNPEQARRLHRSRLDAYARCDWKIEVDAGWSADQVASSGGTAGQGIVRYLIFSDVHASVDALEAVLRSVRRKRFDVILSLGDLIGYGAAPNQVIEMVRRLRGDVRHIRGNHDKVASGVEEGLGFNPVALAAARWTRNRLSEVESPLRRRAAAGPGPRGRVPLCPRLAARRRRLHLLRARRERGVPHRDGVRRLLLRPHPHRRLLHAPRRRDAHAAARDALRSSSSRACAI